MGTTLIGLQLRKVRKKVTKPVLRNRATRMNYKKRGKVTAVRRMRRKVRQRRRET